MKLNLPSNKDCRYIKKKLRIFWKKTKDNKFAFENSDLKEFNQARNRIFKFFQLSNPKIVWMKDFGLGRDNILGRCNYDGSIELKSPYYHNYHAFEGWLNTFYHEIAHYVLWYDWEKKAREFASKMEKRG